MPGEFEIIRRYFSKNQADESVLLGVGDDAAVIRMKEPGNLVVATDMLVAGRHFPQDIPARSIGHRALAVNLSDLAAMGATPRWALLQLSLAEVDDEWLAAFSEGLFCLADQHGVKLVGGDTVRGPLSVGMTLLGETATPVTRAGAKTDDVIFISGAVGDALIGLRAIQGKLEGKTCIRAQQKFLFPEPRIQLGLALSKYVTAMIDTSDGLLSDLEKLVTSSQRGANIDIGSIPLSSEAGVALINGITRSELLNGGDDYELCFTANKQDVEKILLVAAGCDVPVTPIGHVSADKSRAYTFKGEPWLPGRQGFDHFNNDENATKA